MFDADEAVDVGDVGIAREEADPEQRVAERVGGRLGSRPVEVHPQDSVDDPLALAGLEMGRFVADKEGHPVREGAEQALDRQVLASETVEHALGERGELIHC